MHHLHKYNVKYKNVKAEYIKGNREVVYCSGNYKLCRCGKGILVPHDVELQTVDCEMMFKGKE